MKQRLSFGKRMLVGFTLFSMFFGAGNLIFPPFLGVKAGRQMWPAMGGFFLSAVFLPVLGVAAVALAGSLEKLAGRVHPRFAVLFTVLIYLSIGPCLAIPRTAGTSYEMAVLPFLGQQGSKTVQLLYTAVFFSAASGMAFCPERLSDRIGKIMTPCLLILIALLFAGCVCWPMETPAEPEMLYAQYPAVRGFLEGYQTMDTMAALNFGIVIALNIRAMGVTREGDVVRETIFSGVIAGGMLIAVYSALAYLGAVSGAGMQNAENGARILTWAAEELYGKTGLRLLAVIFLIACFNVCVGLLCCCGRYFSELIPGISYRLWVLLFAVVSFGISNVGLTRILAISVPVIHAIYPAAIVLILLAFLQPWIRTFPRVYPCCIFCTGLISIVETWSRYVGEIPVVTGLIARLPGFEYGLGWLLPALAGALAGCLFSGFGQRTVKTAR